LTKNEALRKAMGRNGQAYVNANYRWDIILHKYERMMARLKAPGAVRESAPEPERERERDRRPPQRPGGGGNRDRRPQGRGGDRRPRR
jgi:hypothetical protein